jgi:hypothetical protein
LIRISGFPLYISIRPVILTRFPSMPLSIGDLKFRGKNAFARQFRGVSKKPRSAVHIRYARRF